MLPNCQAPIPTPRAINPSSCLSYYSNGAAPKWQPLPYSASHQAEHKKLFRAVQNRVMDGPQKIDDGVLTYPVRSGRYNVRYRVRMSAQFEYDFLCRFKEEHP